MALSLLALLFVLSARFSAETMGGNGGDGSRTDLKTDGGPLCTNERFEYDWAMTYQYVPAYVHSIMAFVSNNVTLPFFI
jgi:hypothetical protein